MEYRYSFSLFLVTIIGAGALNLASFHVAEASPESKGTTILGPFAQEPNKPVVLARLKSSESQPSLKTSLLSCETNRLNHNLSAIFLGDTDICSPTPIQTSAKVAPDLNRQRWLLGSSPEQIVFKKNLKEGQTLSVELVGANMLPWPATVEISKLGLDYTAQVFPTAPLPEETDMYLVANVYGKNRDRLENWLVMLAISKSNGT